jgi:hypothetical protein
MRNSASGSNVQVCDLIEAGSDSPVPAVCDAPCPLPWLIGVSRFPPITIRLAISAEGCFRGFVGLQSEHSINMRVLAAGYAASGRR